MWTITVKFIFCTYTTYIFFLIHTWTLFYSFFGELEERILMQMTCKFKCRVCACIHVYARIHVRIKNIFHFIVNWNLINNNLKFKQKKKFVCVLHKKFISFPLEVMLWMNMCIRWQPKAWVCVENRITKRVLHLLLLYMCIHTRCNKTSIYCVWVVWFINLY